MEKCSHKLRNLLLFICLVAFSTLTFSCADDKKEDLTGLITYFKIKVNNEVFEGTIDEGTRRISFQGIKSISGYNLMLNINEDRMQVFILVLKPGLITGKLKNGL